MKQKKQTNLFLHIYTWNETDQQWDLAFNSNFKYIDLMSEVKVNTISPRSGTTVTARR